MTTRSMQLLVLALIGLALAIPATATITYCSSGCSNSNSGLDYAAFETAASAYSFSSSPANFVSGNLDGGGVYTDPSGAVFFGFANTTATALSVNGTSLAEPSGFAGTSIQITLPANTYAFAMRVSAASFASPYVELINSAADFNGGNADFNLVITSSSDSQFFGIISSTPITSLFIGNLTSSGALRINDFALGTTGATSETPEMSTMGLIGSGLLGLGFLRRRAVHKPDGLPA
jgi:hypothetical protein